ncbi:ABC transporter permease [Acidiferrimicrobium sp. IK]|uniref:ABC transporter permease n=1 Tax=Acidiferrimicrobium sp. IK TaxID=2871700 RepID=UPI0021CAFEFC|nr:ABC transporter permease [Acidiferrimicrobium sp. IK]MCU4183733.1 ABC transporter permease [Acidiferrimicrobium sp. IK]
MPPELRADQDPGSSALVGVAPAPEGAPGEDSRSGPLRRGAAVVLPALVALVVVGVVWQLLATHNRYLLPRPAATWSQLAHHPGLFASDARTTLVEALLGLGIGFVAAVVLAVLMSQVRVVQRAVMPLAVVLNVTPVVAVAPAMVVAFGFGRTPKVIVTSIIVFFPALINALTGLRSSDPRVLDVMATLHASRRETLWRVQLPSALPNLFAAARVCLPLSVIGAVVAEFVAPGSSAGLGTLITQASSNNQLDRVYAAIICLAAMGVALTLVIAALERWLLAWSRHARSDR